MTRRSSHKIKTHVFLAIAHLHYFCVGCSCRWLCKQLQKASWEQVRTSQVYVRSFSIRFTGFKSGLIFFSTVEKSYFYIPSTQGLVLTAYKKARYTLLTPSILVCVIFGGNHFCGARHKPIHNGSISSSGIDLFGFDFLFRSFSQCCRGQTVFPLIFYQSSNYSFLTCLEEL